MVSRLVGRSSVLCDAAPFALRDAGAWGEARLGLSGLHIWSERSHRAAVLSFLPSACSLRREVRRSGCRDGVSGGGGVCDGGDSGDFCCGTGIFVHYGARKTKYEDVNIFILCTLQ